MHGKGMVDMENQFDLVIIGSGPGGYVAAIKAAKMGKKIALIESRDIGGTCLNRGCIPTKTLMHSSHLYYEAQHLQEVGITVEGIRLDLDKLRERKESVVSRMRQGIVGLLEANKVTVIHGQAQITGPKKIEVRSTFNDETHHSSDHCGIQEFHAEKILIATGSKPIKSRLEGADLPGVITSDELLSLEKTYQKLLIIGGGVIGIEFATIYQEMGFEVEIIEALDRILPNMDKEISQSIAMSLKKKGVTIHTKARVTRILLDDEDTLACEYTEKDTTYTTKAEGILLAVGRRANTEGLFADGLNIMMDGANIQVNEDFETSIPGIFAIGDVVNRAGQLAHVASAQGVFAVEKMFGHMASINLSVIPSCIYTTPEVASVGMSEEEATQAGYHVKVGKYPMLGNGKTLLSAGERGFIKVITDVDTLRILGAVLLCERATDMVGEFASAIVNELTIKDMAAVIRPHPTYCEAITEAVEDVEGMAIHLMPKRG
jgi:dihydrolipoamide dehydrogenase